MVKHKSLVVPQRCLSLPDLIVRNPHKGWRSYLWSSYGGLILAFRICTICSMWPNVNRQQMGPGNTGWSFPGLSLHGSTDVGHATPSQQKKHKTLQPWLSTHVGQLSDLRLCRRLVHLSRHEDGAFSLWRFPLLLFSICQSRKPDFHTEETKETEDWDESSLLQWCLIKKGFMPWSRCP